MAGTKQFSDELKKYGYVFSVKKAVAEYVVVGVCCVLLGRYFGLLWQFIIAILLFLFAILPLFIRNAAKHKYEQQRFSDVNVYIEQFLYSFQKNRKILETLSDVERIFEKGEMKNTIHKAKAYITGTYGTGDVEKHALMLIECAYPSRQLKMAHHFALQVEKNGGQCSMAIALLLEARRIWADRTYLLLKEKKKYRFNIILSIVVSLSLCSIIFLISQNLQISMEKSMACQLVTSVVLFVDILIFYIADKKFALGYLEEANIQPAEEKELWARYERYQKKSWMPLAKKANKKRITSVMEQEFPNWLMQVSLLLQSENVQVAIQKSYYEAPEILKPQIHQFLISVKKQPAAIEPYLSFMEDFTLPEIKSTMKMLYSISEGSGGDGNDQIMDMIRRNQILMDKGEALKNENHLAGWYGLFLAPQITGGVKLVTDLLVIMMMYFSKMGV